MSTFTLIDIDGNQVTFGKDDMARHPDWVKDGPGSAFVRLNGQGGDWVFSGDEARRAMSIWYNGVLDVLEGDGVARLLSGYATFSPPIPDWFKLHRSTDNWDVLNIDAGMIRVWYDGENSDISLSDPESIHELIEWAKS